MIDYTRYITLEPGKRSGQPCIRGLRITVYDVLSYLAAGDSVEKLLLHSFIDVVREDGKTKVIGIEDALRNNWIEEGFYIQDSERLKAGSDLKNLNVKRAADGYGEIKACQNQKEFLQACGPGTAIKESKPDAEQKT